MAIQRIEAEIECDGCAERFGIKVDRDATIPSGWTLDQVVENMFHRGEMTFEMIAHGKKTIERRQLDGNATLQGGFMLCPKCTVKVDKGADEAKIGLTWRVDVASNADRERGVVEWLHRAPPDSGIAEFATKQEAMDAIKRLGFGEYIDHWRDLTANEVRRILDLAAE